MEEIKEPAINLSLDGNRGDQPQPHVVRWPRTPPEAARLLTVLHTPPSNAGRFISGGFKAKTAGPSAYDARPERGTDIAIRIHFARASPPCVVASAFTWEGPPIYPRGIRVVVAR